MRARRIVLSTFLAVLMLAGCGGGELTLTEYVEEINAIFDTATAKYERIVESPEGLVLIVGQGEHFGFDTRGAQLTDFTPTDLHVALVQVAGIQVAALAAAAEIEPPEQIAELHALYFRELPISQLAARAATAGTWEELSETPEMAAYRNALAADNDVCADFQAILDATAARGVFEDVPWMPSELTEVVDYALGCDVLPANPQDVYRPAGPGGAETA